MTSPIERLLAKLSDAKKSGKGWSARCPAHEDHNPSLSINEGDDGRALVNCHVGCSVDAVCQALGLTTADLFPPSTASASAKPRQSSKNGGLRGHANGKPTEMTFASANVAIAELERRHGPRSDMWIYHNPQGEPVGVIVRWDMPDGKKKILPVSLHGDSWRIGGMPEPRPLYGLPELANANRVYVCEGEKSAEAARSIGLVATTSAHGAESPGKTDWLPLAGKDVVILPDNNAPGRKYADKVASLLAELTAAPVVKDVELPDLPDGGDIADFIAARAGTAPAELRRMVEALVDEAEQIGIPPPAQDWPEIVSFDVLDLPDFPTHVLPPVLRDWVKAESHATQTPADLAGLLALAVCSATIARRVIVNPRGDWREPVNLFAVVLLEPGNRKSAVFTDAIQPLKDLESELIEAARPVVARELSDRRQSEALLKKLEKTAAEKGDADAREQAGNLAAKLAEQPEPTLPRLIVDDATSEKLGMMLAEQGGRIASMSPEGGVFDLMAGMYSKSGMAQFDVYLKGHSGDDLITDRVSRKSVHVPHPAITCGFAIQPQVIEGLAANAAFRGRGLLGRFLYAAPQSWIGRRKIGAEAVPEPVREAFRQAVRTLAQTEGERDLRLTPSALSVLHDWETEIEGMLADGGDMEFMRDWGGKLAGATVRIAAVLHCVEHGPTGNIGEATLLAAIEIARYLIPHAEAALNMMLASEGTANDDARYVLRWIDRHGWREFTKRDAQQHGKWRFPIAEDIDPALEGLVQRGYIRLKPSVASGAGRPASPMYEVNPAHFEKAANRSHNSQKSAERPESGNSENIESASEQPESADRVHVTI